MSAHRHNPWMSVADLFSSFSMVILVLFAIAMKQRSQVEQVLRAQIPHDAGLPGDAGTGNEENPELARSRFMERLRAILHEVDELVHVDVDARKIVVRSRSFRVRESCLQPDANRAFQRIAGTICDQLFQEHGLAIHIEGHADPRAFAAQLHGDTRCGAFSNNTELSSARAAQVREVIAETCRARCPAPGGARSDDGGRGGSRTSSGSRNFCDGMDSSYVARHEAEHLQALRLDLCARLPVTGFGGSSPVDPDPSAPANRRVELHLLWNVSPRQTMGICTRFPPETRDGGSR